MARAAEEVVSAKEKDREENIQRHNGANTSHKEYRWEHIANDATDGDKTKYLVRRLGYSSAGNIS